MIIRGVWTALITPFNDKNEIDLPVYRKLLKRQVEAKVAGVIPCGTTGESPTLSQEEKKNLILTTLEELKGTSVKVIAGTGSNDTKETVAFSRWASEQGVTGVLIVTPYYNKPSQAGLEAHFRAIADNVTCDVILYNVPGRTVVSLTASTVCSLATHSKITAIKEATGNVGFASEILDALAAQKSKMTLLSGDDVTFFPLLAIGAAGVISVASNLYPEALVKIQDATEKGDLARARSLHRLYYPVFRDLFIDANPIPVKYAMAQKHLCENRLRLPLVPLSDENMAKLNRTIAKLTENEKATQ